MPPLAHGTTLLIYLFLGGLAAAVASKLMSGGISTRHLLFGRMATGEMYLSPERIQLLTFTIWVASSYLLNVLQHRAADALPDVSTNTLALLGGSHGIYIAGKAYSMLLRK